MKLINFSNVMLLLIIVGIMLMIFQYAQLIKQCDEPKVLYKYIPRDFTVDTEYPDNISYVFKDMFSKSQPYIIDYGNDNKRKIEPSKTS